MTTLSFRLPMSEDHKPLSADEYRQISKQAIIEYLKDHTSAEERKEVYKSALSEWMKERFAEFGWFSFKALAVVAFGVLMYFWLFINGWHKG
jgi:hypothetical protein